MTTPASGIYLFKGVPLDNTYRNVVRGGISLASLSGNFSSRQWLGQTWCRIVGQYNNKARVDCSPNAWGDSPFRSDLLFEYNYIAIQNADYNPIFGFITDVLYINDNVAEITFEIDAFNTYYHDYTFNACLVERASCDNTTELSDYSLPDKFIETEYDTIAENDWAPFTNAWTLVLFLASAKGDYWGDPDTPIEAVGQMTGFLQGCQVAGYDAYPFNPSVSTELMDFLNRIYKKGLQCLNAVLMPRELYRSYPSQIAVLGSAGKINAVTSARNHDLSNNELNGIDIKNRKMLTYPYTYLEVTNNMGDVKRFAYEGFSGGAPLFEVRAVSVPMPCITLVPKNYFGKSYDYENALVIDQFPTMPVQSDNIASWQAQNNTSDAIKGVGAVASGAITGAMVANLPGAIIGGLLGGATAITTHIANEAHTAHTPSQMTSMSGSGSLLTLSQIGKLGFTFRHKCLRSEAIKAIDDYMTRNGVSYQKLETPPLSRGDKNYHVIKTSGCTITCKDSNGNKTGMPAWAVKKICEIHDNGVVYWDNYSDVGKYD